MRNMRAFGWLALLLAAGFSNGQAGILTIENESLLVRWDDESGRITMSARPSGRTVLEDTTFPEAGGTGSIVDYPHATFGPGRAIQVAHTNGNRDVVALFPKLPFALFQRSLHNGGNVATVTRQVRTLSGGVSLGRAPSQLKTLGTGGLLAPDKNPGSYVWLAVAEPTSRNGLVFGWLTHERGSGVLFSKVEGDAVRVEAQLDYGRLRVAPGKAVPLETLAVGYFNDARLGLEAWADAVAKVQEIHLPPQPSGYCTWYSQPHGGASDEKHIAELSTFASKELAPYGFSVVQIDDHWQAGLSTNGPKRNFTTHAPKGPYPGGMKAAADQIKSLGLVPGLWFMPFAGTYYDPFFKDHQDWFVRHENGGPFETAWGGTCLDMTHPGARAHLSNVVHRIAHEWGYDYFKMDGLWTGTGTRQQYVNSSYKDDAIGDAVFHNPEKTNLEAYRDGLRLVREVAGRKIFLLGCCAPQNMRSYGSAFGLVDAMRIGPDNGSDWKGLLRGPLFGSRHYFLHGRVWYNDPDPVYVRTNIPLKHAQLICSWVALSGQLNLSSEWLPGLPAERLDVLRRTLPGHGSEPRPADLFDTEPARLWLVTDTRRTPRRDVIGLFNWGDQELALDYPLDRLGLDAKTNYSAFDYWSNAPVPPIQGRLKITVPPQSCRVIAVRSRENRPLLISTSRHVTQGMLDVLEERWEETSLTLHGRSQVIAGNAYELRLAQPQQEVPWSMDTAEAVAETNETSLSVVSKVEGELVRITFDPKFSGVVRWKVTFRNDKNR